MPNYVMLISAIAAYYCLRYSPYFIEKFFFFGVANDPEQFPDNFKFGSASSAYQIEGAWNVDGRGPSIWDEATHNSVENIVDRSNGDDAAKSYYFYKNDVKALKETGMDLYRFSISWSRILPDGDTSIINELGLQYYDNLINELLENNIKPMITLYHWDLPQKLQDIGGWLNPDIAELFEDYARIVFDRYADRVKLWITFNEPLVFCNEGYGDGTNAPFTPSPGVGNYICGHHVLIAHANTYYLYKEDYVPKYGGKIGIAINCAYAWPKYSSKSGDNAAVDRFLDFSCGWFGHPIFSEDGGYPPVMVETINRKSEEEGRETSRLPKMSDEMKMYVQGTADFWGLIYYTSFIAEQPSNFGEPSTNPSFNNDMDVSISLNPAWRKDKLMGMRAVPVGLRRIASWIKNQYHNPDVYIAENGWPDNEVYDDVDRVRYLKEHLQAVLDAIFRDGCNIRGHLTWSLIDNFEWTFGYTVRFGIYHVDFNNPDRKRTPKASAEVLKEIIQTRLIPLDYSEI